MINRAKLRGTKLDEDCKFAKTTTEADLCVCYGLIDNADKWTYCKDQQKMDFSFYSYGVKYWMPMPSAPKEEK